MKRFSLFGNGTAKNKRGASFRSQYTFSYEKEGSREHDKKKERQCSYTRLCVACDVWRGQMISWGFDIGWKPRLVTKCAWETWFSAHFLCQFYPLPRETVPSRICSTLINEIGPAMMTLSRISTGVETTVGCPDDGLGSRYRRILAVVVPTSGHDEQRIRIVILKMTLRGRITDLAG